VSPLDRGPQRIDLALGGEQVLLVRLVAQHLSVAEIDQLEQVGHPTGAAPQDERVEPHLEQRLRFDVLAGGATGLVVDDPHRTGGVDVDTVDVAAQQHARVEHVLDVELALRRLQPLRILEVEVRRQQ